MSWQTYVDTHLIGTEKIAKASILGHDGSTWATSKDFVITPEEGKALAKGITAQDCFYSTGVHLAGTKYTYLRGVKDENVYAKKGDSGVCVVKTKQAIIVGIYVEGTQPGQATVVVEKVGDYLKNAGY
ncbi:profilin-2-like [Saccoglossus kowalevskii]|uniref:Profilin n=1 Tax=Saccoglossus kowalevskii TaxID=10224 RepID=A0ABM0GJ81_SACKO|nr:PREDICTED: profilin-2-like [Saccoglossus kowalevskii]